MIAVCRIRDQPHYRRHAFVSGLERAGYSVVTKGGPKGPQDVLIIWNRYGWFEQDADRWEASGGTVIVAENGYCGKDEQGRQFYALAVHGHNGSGRWPTGDGRFVKLGVELQPWRSGDHILVCGQRGIGSREMRSPANWHEVTARKLAKITARPITVRQHPGRFAPPVSLDATLRNAYACVIWSSGCGVRALELGVPVFYDAPHWICEGAAQKLTGDVDSVLCDDAKRRASFERMAWAQWSVAEIESGEPFRWLTQC